MDIGKQQRVIMVEPLDLPIDEVLLDPSDESFEDPQRSHTGNQDPHQLSLIHI